MRAHNAICRFCSRVPATLDGGEHFPCGDTCSRCAAQSRRQAGLFDGRETVIVRVLLARILSLVSGFDEFAQLGALDFVEANVPALAPLADSLGREMREVLDLYDTVANSGQLPTRDQLGADLAELAVSQMAVYASAAPEALPRGLER